MYHLCPVRCVIFFIIKIKSSRRILHDNNTRDKGTTIKLGREANSKKTNRVTGTTKIIEVKGVQLMYIDNFSTFNQKHSLEEREKRHRRFSYFLVF